MMHGLPILAAAWAAILAGSLGGCAENGTTLTGPTGAAVQLQVLKSFRAGGGDDRWDLLTVDSPARRVYVARTSRVMVFDADLGTVLGEVAGVNGAHGVAVVPQLNKGFATAGKDQAVVVFDLKTLQTLQKIKIGPKPDAILYDSASGKVFAFDNAGGGITILDPAALDQAPVVLAVEGKLELPVSDGHGRIFVNVEDKSEVVVIDAKQQKVVAHWPLAPGDEPTGLALDVAHRRLFAGCANQKMIVLEADSGKVLAALPIGQGVDGVAFDPVLGLAISANGRDGTLTAVREIAPGRFAAVQTLKTIEKARTVAADPQTHQFYLPGLLPVPGGLGEFGLVVVGAAAKK